MYKYIFVSLFVLFIPLCFKILKSLEIEKYFKPGKTLEIRISYIIFSIILAELLTCGFERIFSLFY